MKSRWLHNLILALVVAALALFLVFKPEKAGPQKFKLSTLAAASVTMITLQPAGRPAIVLLKQGGEWRMTAPFQARVDRFRVDSALEILDAQSETRLPAKELEKFGLDKPFVTMTVNGQTFLFGGQQPVSSEIYVATGDHVYLVPPVYMADAARGAADFAAKKLLADSESPIGFTLPGLKLTRHDGKWRREPDDGKLSADQLNRFADEWRLATAMSVAQAGEAKAEPIQVTFANGKTLDIGIVARDPDVVLRREDEHLEYRFAKDVGERLLDPAKPQSK